jgi:hypothetical protein
MKHRLFLGSIGLSLALGTTLALATVQATADASPDEITIKEGRDRAIANIIPWSGDWWAAIGGGLALGWGERDTKDFVWNADAGKYEAVSGFADDDLSTLRKYDLWTERVTGVNPRAAEFELHGDNQWGGNRAFDHHVDPAEAADYDEDGVAYGWWGHCNGWAAASLVEREPFAPVVANGIRFDVADLKGLLAELYSGVNTARGGDTQAKNAKWSEHAHRTAQALLKQLDGAVLKTKATKTTDNSKTSRALAGGLAKTKRLQALFDKWTRTTGYELDPKTSPEQFRIVLTDFIGHYEEALDQAYQDLNPAEFHTLLVTTIKEQQSGIVLDMDAGPEVWNFPCHAYETTIEFVRHNEDGGKTFNVSTTVHYQDDGVSEAIIGTRTLAKTYTYELHTDPKDRLIDGTWTGRSVDEHPDFAWFPKYNPTGADYGENHKVNWGQVEKLFPRDRSTADARIITLSVNGVASDDHRSDEQARTTDDPYLSSGPVKLTASVLPGVKIDRVTYERMELEAVKPDGFKAARGDLLPLGESKQPPYALGYDPKASGTAMIVARAYAGNELVSQDEFTVTWASTPGQWCQCVKGSNPIWCQAQYDCFHTVCCGGPRDDHALLSAVREQTSDADEAEDD